LSQQRNREESARRYLLGELSEEQGAALEEQFLADDEEFEELEIAEGELIDEYVRGGLPPRGREKLEQVFRTSPRLLERVEFARLLATNAAAPAPQRSDPEPAPVVKSPKSDNRKGTWRDFFGPTLQLAPGMRLAMAAPLVLLLMTSVALVMVWNRFRTETQKLAANQQRISQLETEVQNQNARNRELETELTGAHQERDDHENQIADLQQQLSKLRPQILASSFSFFLNPAIGTRGGGGAEPKVSLKPEVTTLELQLNVDGGDYPLFQALLQNADRKTILRRRLKPVRRGSHKIIPFNIPTKLLTAGSYSVHVDGLLDQNKPDTFNDYFFRIPAR